MAKAIHVTSKAECSRRYGAQAKTYVVSGVVVKVVEKNFDGSNQHSKVVFVDHPTCHYRNTVGCCVMGLWNNLTITVHTILS
jgi:hypothetical protein